LRDSFKAFAAVCGFLFPVVILFAIELFWSYFHRWCVCLC